MYRARSWPLVILASVALGGCTLLTALPGRPQLVVLQPPRMQLMVGESAAFEVHPLVPDPSDPEEGMVEIDDGPYADESAYTWTVLPAQGGQRGGATVDDGLVTGVLPGEYVVQATGFGELGAARIVQVVASPAP